MTKETQILVSPDPDKEIDFIYPAQKLWSGRKVILKCIMIFLIVGVLVAFLSPKEYMASSTMVPQVTDPKAKLGALSGLAAMAGLSLNSLGSSELSPSTYPEIISSVPFQLELMNTPLNFKRMKEPVTLFDYYTKIRLANPFIKYTVGLPSLIVKAIKGKSDVIHQADSTALYELSEKQKDVQKILEEQVGVAVNDQNGYIVVWCILPEDYAAAQLAKKTQLLLQKYITEFKIEKAKANHDFIEQRYEEAKKKYQQTQAALANFKDRNKNVSINAVRSEQDQLSAEYTLVFGLYSELAKKLEQAKIEIKEETPVFTIIKPVAVPTEKFKPNRPYIIGIFVSIGFIFGMGIVLGRDYAFRVKRKWKEASR